MLFQEQLNFLRGIFLDKFIYKKFDGITVLSASFNDFKYKKHCHEEYAFGVTLQGVQNYNLAGSFQSSTSNCIMLFNPEEIHDGWSWERNRLDYVMVYIKPGKFLDLIEAREMIKFPDPVIHNSRLLDNILDFVNAVIYEQEDALCSESLVALMNNFSSLLLSSRYSQDDYLIKKSKDIINSSLSEILKLEDISAEFGMSKYQFIRAFKSGAGLSPYQYYINSKIEKARDIVEKYKDVYSAVAELDFTDLTHLNRHFKRIYGVTAAEYVSCIS